MDYFHRCIYLINSPGTEYGHDYVWHVRSGGNVDEYHGYDSYGSPDPNNEQDLRVITFIGSIYNQHNAIRDSYGHKNTGVKS